MINCIIHRLVDFICAIMHYILYKSFIATLIFYTNYQAIYQPSGYLDPDINAYSIDKTIMHNMLYI